MIRAALICLALTALSLCAHAQQQPPQQTASAAFAAQLASLIVGTLEERDACRAQLAAAKPPAQPATPPTPAPESKP